MNNFVAKFPCHGSRLCFHHSINRVKGYDLTNEINLFSYKKESSWKSKKEISQIKNTKIYENTANSSAYLNVTESLPKVQPVQPAILPFLHRHQLLKNPQQLCRLLLASLLD